MDNVELMEAQILAEMSEESVKMGPVNDVIEIDAESRTLKIPSTEILFGVTRDSSVERKYFRCPRIVGNNVDLSKLSIRIHFENANKDRDKYIVDDVQVNGTHIMFSWLLSEKVLRYSGAISFAIGAVTVDDDGNTTASWNTAIFTGTVLNGLEVDDLSYIEESESRDVLAQLLTVMDNKSNETVQNVKDEGNVQVINIQNESTVQMEAIEAKGAETLSTIPEDYSVVSALAETNTRSKAPAIKQTVSGTSLSFNDAAEMPLQGLKLFGESEQAFTTGKQLLNNTGSTYSSCGVTFTSNDDGSITITTNGVSTGEAYYLFDFKNDIPMYKSELIASITGSDDVSMVIGYFTGADSFVNEIVAVNSKVSKSFVYPDDAIATRTFLAVNAGKTVNATVYPLLRLASIEDESYEPYTGGLPSPSPAYPQDIRSIGDNEVVISTFGKNLIDVDAMLNEQLVKNSDGTYTLTKNGAGSLRFSNTASCKIPKGIYTLSVGAVSGPEQTIRIVLRDSNNKETSHSVDTVKPKTITVEVDVVSVRVYIPSDVDDGAYSTFNNLMLEMNDTMTRYEPYKDAQSITISTVLARLYKNDISAYVRDEIDLERGVYIQRIAKRTVELIELTSASTGRILGVFAPMDKTEDCGSALCTAAIHDHIRPVTNADGTFYENPANFVFVGAEDDTFEDIQAKFNGSTMYYELATPVEIPLSEETLQAYRTLCTNYPNNTVVNNADALMELTYAADTKSYIDNKFAELQATILGNS